MLFFTNVIVLIIVFIMTPPLYFMLAIGWAVPTIYCAYLIKKST